MNRVHATALAALLSIPATARAEPITLTEAVRRATDANADLKALEAEVRAADAVTRQAGRRSNPEVELSIENAGAEEAATETTVAVGQLVELGGDRRARIDAASAAREIVGLEYDARRREVEARVRTAFAAILAARQQHAIARENRHGQP
jgi:cobalt-zinc-cadmium efflux system outer membrane protein